MSKSSRKKSVSREVPQRPSAQPEARPTAAPVTSTSPTHTPPPPLTAPATPTSLPVAGGLELIRFDRRVTITLGIFVGLFALMVLFKLHFGSEAMWNQLLPDGAPYKRGLLAGQPRQIRMDEYAVGAPWNLSNYHNGLKEENETIGGQKTPLLLMAVKHPSTIFKFANWGMLFLDVERGYAWMMDSTPLILLVGSFLFFLLLTRNQFWLSLTGALTLLFSSGTVSWTFSPGNVIGFCCAAFVLGVYLLISRKLSTILIVSTLLVWVLVNFALIVYPPYQVPMVYFFTLVFIGYVINERKHFFPLRGIPLKLIGIAVPSVLAGIILYSFRKDVQDTLTAVTSTVYPGKRVEMGGTGFIANWYSEFFSWFFTDTSFPKSWLNSCEMAHYLNFTPVVIPLCVVLWVQTKRIDWMLLLASVFMIVMLVWMEVGLPKGLATASLLSMSPTRRAQIPMGVGGIVLLFLYLASLKNAPLPKMPVWFTPVAMLGVLGYLLYAAYVNINDSDGMIKSSQTFLPIVFFTALGSLLIFSLRTPYRVPVFCAGILLYLLPNMKLNPIAVGLSPIMDHSLYKTIRPIVESDPDARWMVNGNQFLTYMVTATGAKQITGVKYIPDRKHIFSVLDPTAKRDSAYNRYAHVTYQSYINGRDSVILVNQYEDGYVIAMDPCSPKMKQLNVKYQVFDHPTQPVETRCMQEIARQGNVVIYKVNL